MVAVAGRDLTVTSPGKVFFAERGETKLDLVRYYLAVAEPLMRTAGGRPTLMQRFPHGAEGSSFFQKRVPATAPEWLQTTIVSTPNGTTARALVLADMAHVIWAVNLACLGFHLWPFVHDRPDFADELRLDLDPQPGVAFDEARTAARELKTLLDELGIRGWPKTTGNRGIHVYTRLAREWSPVEVRRAAVAVARELARRRPDVITDAWWKEERGERIFVGVRGVVGAGPARRTGVDAVPLGRARRHRPRRLHHGHRAGPRRGAGRPVGRHRRRSAVARTPPRDVRARPGLGPGGRAVAARLPEDAG